MSAIMESVSPFYNELDNEQMVLWNRVSLVNIYIYTGLMHGASTTNQNCCYQVLFAAVGSTRKKK